MQKLSLLFEKFPKYLFAAILIIVPLFPKFPLIDIPGTYVSIRFEDLLLFILGILTAIKILQNFKSFLKDEIMSAFLIFFGVAFVSLLSGVFVTHTVGISQGLLHFFRRVEYIIPFVACLTLLTKSKISKNLDYYLKILMIVTVIAFIYGFGQRYLYFPIITTQNEEYSKGVALRYTPGSHINSTFAGHYDLAAYMVLVLPVFITMLFTLKDRVSQLFLLVTTGAGIWLLINSISRIAQVSYLLATSIALILVRKFKVLGVVIVVSLFLISMSSDLDARFMRIIQVYFNRGVTYVESKFVALAQEISPPAQPVIEDRSTSIRLNVEWPRAIRSLTKNPILGTGYSSIGLATDNDYLRMLGETGILGFFAFWLIIIRIIKVFAGAFPFNDLSTLEKSFVVGIIGGLGGTLLTAVFIDLFEASKFAIMFWLLLGLAVYLVKKKSFDYKNTI